MNRALVSRGRAVILLALVPGLLGWLCLRWPVTGALETRYGFDLLMQLRGVRQPPPAVCVVAIDDASAIELGHDPLDPWPRAVHARLIGVLAREGARAIAVDVLFDEPRDPAQDVELELALFDAGNVVLAATVERVEDPRFRSTRRIDPHPPFAESAAAVASVELPTDADGVVRRAWLVLDERPSLALAAYRVATGGDAPRADGAARLIDYYGPPRTIPTVSLYQALDPDQYLPAGYFRDRIVFVGASQPAALTPSAAKDSFPTPFSGGDVGLTYGVEIHATVAANLVDGSEIRLPLRAVETLLVLALALLASLLFIVLRPLAGAAMLCGLELLAWSGAYFAFVAGGLWLPVVIPSVVQLPAAYVVSLVWYYVTTARDREKIRRAFAFYLSPEMIRRIAENPEALSLGGEEVVATAVFTDIRGFTRIAERMGARETAAMLNRYFSEVTGRIFDTGGTLIKYIGDAVFAIWGAPVPFDDHATRACRAAIEIARAEQAPGDGAGSELITRIGIHTGSMLVGNLGSAQRFDYTAIGDTVNLAARLESLNKQFGTRALVSAETLGATDGTFVTRALGRVRVAGREEPVAIHELLGQNGAVTRPDAETIGRFERAVGDFVAGGFERAAEGFREVRERCGGRDGPSELYLDAIARRRAEPTAGEWDGVIRFTEK
ncbi:MAG TPA: adenylate/guanylate cyclase domain-containing protein [Candidatus Polarisedimenticolaceae bacterium]|nr:adenylate/guanylate cyclase domain-containing protein [Candidatus Polarisedimenticolaceae bacterium]